MPGDRRRQPKPDELWKLGVGGEGVVGGKRPGDVPGSRIGELTDGLSLINL